MKFEELTITNIGGGAMPELFAEALGRILEDIADVNKPADKDRAIEFKIIFRTDEERAIAGIAIESKVKLAARKAATGYMHISIDGDKLSAYVNNPRQEVLKFDPADGPVVLNGGKE